mmetsp:Transcript_9083/g.22286  ORF Transcript_9083/g.22286 Transcript_9083/m.22286 type:complete len:136 (+) Transcript_9083:551-958(+)
MHVEVDRLFQVDSTCVRMSEFPVYMPACQAMLSPLSCHRLPACRPLTHSLPHSRLLALLASRHEYHAHRDASTRHTYGTARHAHTTSLVDGHSTPRDSRKRRQHSTTSHQRATTHWSIRYPFTAAAAAAAEGGWH